MDKELAIDILQAVACCSVSGLSCTDNCPLWDEKKGRCRPWTNEEVIEAVYELGRRNENG